MLSGGVSVTERLQGQLAAHHAALPPALSSAHRLCPDSHTEPVEEQGFIPLGQLSTLYFLHYLCPSPFISCLAGPQGHYVTWDMATSISGPGEPSPQPVLIIYFLGLCEAQWQLSWCMEGPAGALLREDHCAGSLGL